MRYASPDEVKRALKNVDFPATKEELIRAAEAVGAPDNVIAALRAVPPEEYANRAEVARSIPTDPTADLDLSPAQRAEQPGRPATVGTRSGCRSICVKCRSRRWRKRRPPSGTRRGSVPNPGPRNCTPA